MNRVDNNLQEAPRDHRRGASSIVDDSQQTDDFYLLFGQNIKKIRKKGDITQAELSKQVFINRSYLAEIEAGRRHVSLFIVFKIAKALGVSLDVLLGIRD